MKYSDKVMELYNNSKNVGSLDESDPSVGTAIVGAPSCGDVIKFQIKVNNDGCIEEAKFKAFGCGAAIASSAFVSDLVQGKNFEEAQEISNKHVAESLSLPPVKAHCSVLAEEAITQAIKNYMDKQNS